MIHFSRENCLGNRNADALVRVATTLYGAPLLYVFLHLFAVSISEKLKILYDWFL